MEETFLYRHFDGNGKLLYVGISLSAVVRLAQHREQSHWFNKIRRVEMELFPDRFSAQNAEAKAIAAEHPEFNIRPGRYRPEKPPRLTNENVRQAIKPNDFFSHQDCAKFLKLKEAQLTNLFQQNKIGHALVYYSTQPNVGVVEFKGQNIIDFVEGVCG